MESEAAYVINIFQLQHMFFILLEFPMHELQHQTSLVELFRAGTCGEMMNSRGNISFSNKRTTIATLLAKKKAMNFSSGRQIVAGNPPLSCLRQTSPLPPSHYFPKKKKKRGFYSQLASSLSGAEATQDMWRGVQMQFHEAVLDLSGKTDLVWSRRFQLFTA